MGIFGRNRASSSTPIELSELKLGSVQDWAETLLRMVGMDPAEVARVRQTHPTPVPPPNVDHVFDAGEPPNPWTLAVACAEAAIADALQVYLYAGGRFVTQQQAAEIYARSGLNGLAGAIRFHESRENLQWVHEVVNEKIERSFSAFFVRMVTHYLRDFWPQRKSFRVKVGS